VFCSLRLHAWLVAVVALVCIRPLSGIWSGVSSKCLMRNRCERAFDVLVPHGALMDLHPPGRSGNLENKGHVMRFVSRTITNEKHAKNRRFEWLNWVVLCAITLSWPMAAAARDSSLIASDAPMAPVLIVANYSNGLCSQSLSGNLLTKLVSRPGPMPEAMLSMPEYIVCRTLPEAIALNLRARNVDAVVREFVLPGRVSSSDYSPQEKAFQEKELAAPENAARYALVYTGVAIERNLHFFGFIEVFGPADFASGNRPLLGRFLLDENTLLVTDAGKTALSVAPGIVYHLRSPIGAGAIIANSLQARCTKSGLFGLDKCDDRLHLVAPN